MLRHWLMQNFLVDIGGPFSAILPQLSFEGATKRNRPNLATGDLVYARVAAASRDTDPVLTCIDALGRAAGYGHLKEGIVFPVSTAHARHLLGTPAAPVLQGLGGKLQFEVAVGVNGRVWVAAGSPPTVVVVSNAIREAEFKTPAQVATMCSRLLEGFS